jgi:cytochrome c551/c552
MSKMVVLAAALTLLGLTACNSTKQSISQPAVVLPVPVAANVAPTVAAEAAPKPKPAEPVAVIVIEPVPPQVAEPVAVKAAEPVMQSAAGENPVFATKPVVVSQQQEAQHASEAQPTANAIKPQEHKAKPEVHEAQPAKVAVITQEQAMALARSGNCLACHKIETRLVGPAWKAVGVKYNGDAKAARTIATHIKSGGSFGWNMGAMPPRGGSKILDADVESLAKFIASLR